MIMLDILTIVHGFADTRTASRIRRTCRKLCALIPRTVLYRDTDSYNEYEYGVDDKIHRLDGPAIVSKSGYKHWYRGGIRHREYHPQCTNGYYSEYIVEGQYHREAGPSIVCGKVEEWYLRGKLHRKTGPAGTGERRWISLGKCHRLDGPVCSDIYAIRGVKHRISADVGIWWVVNGVYIRT